MWNEITAAGRNHWLKPFLLPAMVYERTFVVPSDFWTMLVLLWKTISIRWKARISRLNRMRLESSLQNSRIEMTHCMVLVSFKSFSEVSKAQCGHALIIYCIPTLESLEQNSQKSSTAVRRHHCRKNEPNGGPSFGKCFRCKWATHCSKAWQKSAWRNGHKTICKAPYKKK